MMALCKQMLLATQFFIITSQSLFLSRTSTTVMALYLGTDLSNNIVSVTVTACSVSCTVLLLSGWPQARGCANIGAADCKMAMQSDSLAGPAGATCTAHTMLAHALKNTTSYCAHAHFIWVLSFCNSDSEAELPGTQPTEMIDMTIKHGNTLSITCIYSFIYTYCQVLSSNVDFNVLVHHYIRVCYCL